VKNITGLFILIILFSILGCAFYSGHSNNKKENDNSYKSKSNVEEPPENFRLRIKVENWIITKNVLLDNIEDELGRVRVDGIYIYFDEVVVKLVSEKFGNKYFWITKLPDEKDGIFELNAELKENPKYLKSLADVDPPDKVKLAIEVENGKIVDNYFIDIKPWWGNFIFYKKDKKKHYLYFKNSKFDNDVWVCQYPDIKNTGDGKYILILSRM
jgi:hypothetical protein